MTENGKPIPGKGDHKIGAPDDLKACPFCGGRASLYRGDDTRGRVECDDCRARIIYTDPASAVVRWNMRVCA